MNAFLNLINETNYLRETTRKSIRAETKILFSQEKIPTKSTM